MNEAAALIEQAEHLLRRAAALPVEGLSDTDLCSLAGVAEAAGRLVDALRVTTAGEIADRSRPELGTDGLGYRNGCTRPAHLIERIARVSQAEAARRIRLAAPLRARAALTGEVLPPLRPVVADAVRDGRIGVESAVRIVKVLDAASTTATVDQLDLAERMLVDAAQAESADLVQVRALAWREYLDPDGARPRDEVLRGQRRFSIGREVDGMTPFSGVADPLSAGLLRAALAEGTAPDRQPRFLDPSDLDPNDPNDPRLDPRTRDQRQFDTLIGLLTAGTRSRDTTGSLRPTATINVVVRAGDLENGTGPAWIDDVAEPISAHTARTLTCDADISRITLGVHGEVLHLGRRERLFSPAQRRALAVRDGGCIWPGCTAPPSWCHAHHLVEWNHGGRTDLSNGVLLCPAHHHMLHNTHYQVRMIRGTPHLLAPPHVDPDQRWRPLGRQRATSTPTRAAPAAPATAAARSG